MSFEVRYTRAAVSALVLANLLPAKLYANSDEIIVVSGSNQKESWLFSPSALELSQLPAVGMLIDSAQLFNGVAGVQADSRANFAQDTRLSIRGFGSRSAFGIRGVQLLQDGIPLTTPDGQGQLSSVLLDNISYVEVLKGPLATLYGNASGGVISLFSKAPQQNAASVQIAGSEQHRQYQFKTDWVSGDNALSFAAKRFTTEGYRPHSAAEKKQAQLLYFSKLGEGIKLTSRFDYARDPKLQDPLGLSVEDWLQSPEQTASAATRFDTAKTSLHKQLRLSLSDMANEDAWQLSVWTGERAITQRLAFTGSAATSAGGIVVLNREFNGINARYTVLNLNNFHWSIAASMVESRDERQGYINDFGIRGDLRRDQTDKARNQDVSSRINWQIDERFKLQAGWRFSKLELDIQDQYITADNPDDSGNKSFYNNSAALGLSYRISDGFNLYVSTAKGFETPTLAEIAYQREGSGVNLALQESQNTQWETGLKWQSQAISASAAVFQVNSDNELMVDISQGGRTSYRNAAQTQRTGFELQLNWQQSAWLKHAVSAHVIEATFARDELSGKYLPGVAREQLSWRLEAQPWQHDTQLNITTSYRSKVFTDDNNAESAPAAVLIDLAAIHRQQWRQLEFSYWLAINNLLDKTYVGSVIVNQSNGRSFEPAPGRVASAGISVKYQW